MDRAALSVDKRRLAIGFSASASTYDEEATLQREVVRRLIALAPPLQGGVVFEVGCGTGLLTEALQERYATTPLTYILNDLCPGVEQPLRAKVGSASHFVCGDAEEIPWPSDCRLIASSSCIQWWHEPLAFYAKSASHLACDGVLLFSTFGPDNFREIRRVFDTGLCYSPLHEIREALHTHFGSVELYEYRQTLYFDTLLKLLRHLKRTGVNSLGSANHWTPSKLLTLEQEYRKAYPGSTHLPLTYHAIYGKAIHPRR